MRKRSCTCDRTDGIRNSQQMVLKAVLFKCLMRVFHLYLGSFVPRGQVQYNDVSIREKRQVCDTERRNLERPRSSRVHFRSIAQDLFTSSGSAIECRGVDAPVSPSPVESDLKLGRKVSVKPLFVFFPLSCRGNVSGQRGHRFVLGCEIKCKCNLILFLYSGH